MVQALQDARTLADQLEEESARLVRRVATGQVPLSGRPIKIRFGEEGTLLEPRPLPEGEELLDLLKDPQQLRPTPASISLRDAEDHEQRQEWALALEDVATGERVILEGEGATYARLLLQKARVLSALERHREAARVLEALRTRTRPQDLLDESPLRLLLGHRIAEHWEDAGSPSAARSALHLLLEELLAGEVPLPPNRLDIEGRLLLQTLERNELATHLEAVVAGAQLAEQLRHYADQRHHGVINMALSTIISKFFNGK